MGGDALQPCLHHPCGGEWPLKVLHTYDTKRDGMVLVGMIQSQGSRQRSDADAENNGEMEHPSGQAHAISADVVLPNRVRWGGPCPFHERLCSINTLWVVPMVPIGSSMPNLLISGEVGWGGPTFSVRGGACTTLLTSSHSRIRASWTPDTQPGPFRPLTFSHQPGSSQLHSPTSHTFAMC